MKTTKLIFLFLMLAQSTNGWCDQFKVDGISCSTNSDNSSASVTFNNDGYFGEIVIPSSVTYNKKTYSVTSIEDNSFNTCNYLTSVTIPSSVTSIGHSAFAFCTRLLSVTIPNSMTSIGDSAFNGCTSLTTVTIPSSVTSINDFAFSNCSGLKTLICDIETPLSVPSHVFRSVNKANCVLYVPAGCVDAYKAAEEWNTFENICEIDPTAIGNVTVNDNASSAINNLREDFVIDGIKWFTNSDNISVSITHNNYGYQDKIVIPSSVTYNNKVYSVTNIGYEAFRFCPDLTSVTIPNSVTSIGDYAFDGCANLTSITIPSSVTSIGFASFSGCIGLTSVTIPSNVTSIGFSAFSYCASLTSVSIPSSVTSINDFAFASCYGLKTLICDIETPLSVPSHVFRSVNKANCVLYVPAGCVDAYKAAEEWNTFENIREIDPTAIGNVIVNDNASSAIYNLRGQKVDGNNKGVVIKNGKKVFFK